MYCPFDRFKNIFGGLNEGIHSIRFLDTASVDYFLSILGAMLLTYLTKIPLVLTTIGILLFGLILHVLFGVNTNSVKFLGLSC